MLVAALGATALVALAVGAWLVWIESKQLTWQSLLNATYATSVTPRGAALHDGTFEAEAAPGSASKVIVRLADIAAFGDLDGNLAPDAAVVLVSSGGGSGTFVELAAVRNEHGTAHPVSTVLLGDRILVREVRIGGRRILVRLRVRGATDPFSLRTREISRHYVLDGNSLVLVDESEAEVQSAPAENYVYLPVRLDIAAGSSRSVDGFLAPGQIASYVVHGRAGEILDLTVRSDFDNGVLSVSGLTDGMTLVSRREYATQRSLVLPSEQDYSIKVVSLAGYQLAFMLQVQLRAAIQTAAPTTRPTDAPLPSRTPSPLPTPSGAAALVERPLGQASESAVAFARSRSPIWGVAIVVPSRGLVFAANADTQVPLASTVKAVVPEQRWGVTAGTDAASGDRVALKNGWYPGEEGWRVNSIGIVWPRAGDAYAIGIVTDGRVSWHEGIDTIEGIAAPLNAAMP